MRMPLKATRPSPQTPHPQGGDDIASASAIHCFGPTPTTPSTALPSLCSSLTPYKGSLSSFTAFPHLPCAGRVLDREALCQHGLTGHRQAVCHEAAGQPHLEAHLVACCCCWPCPGCQACCDGVGEGYGSSAEHQVACKSNTAGRIGWPHCWPLAIWKHMNPSWGNECYLPVGAKSLPTDLRVDASVKVTPYLC